MVYDDETKRTYHMEHTGSYGDYGDNSFCGLRSGLSVRGAGGRARTETRAKGGLRVEPKEARHTPTQILSKCVGQRENAIIRRLKGT